MKSLDDNKEYSFAAGSLEGKILVAKKDSTKLEFLYEHKVAIYALDSAKGTKSICSGS